MKVDPFIYWVYYSQRAQYRSPSVVSEVPCRRVLEVARAVVARDEERGVDTNDAVVERLSGALPTHSVTRHDVIESVCDVRLHSTRISVYKL